MTDRRIRGRGAAATIALLLAGLAAAWAAVVVIAGGFSIRIGPAVLASRNPVRALAAALVLAAIARSLVSGAEFAQMLGRLAGPRRRSAAAVAGLAAGGVFVFAVAWNTRAAGGSDSSCYVLQADAFEGGEATLTNPVAADLPGLPNAVFAPTGFIPARDYGVAVPICAPGLALAMAGAALVSRGAIFLVVPATSALLVWLTFVYGRRLDGDVTAASAAVLVACSPIVLYQAVQPMSDVPAAALWLGALVGCGRGDRRGDLLGGVCASLAILTRPNLALIVAPLVWLLRDRRAIVRFGLAAAPGIAWLAWLNAARYGSPLSSGYGATGALFSGAHMAANAARYARWVLETQSPLIVLAVGAPWILWRRGWRRAVLVESTAVILTFATYFAYTVFDDWWYIRFLLPALPVMVVFMLVVVRASADSIPAAPWWILPVRGRRLLYGCCVAPLVAWYLSVALSRQVFDLQALESRFVLAGRYAAGRLPADAVVLAVQESGSVRYHGGKATIAWDAIPGDALDGTIDAIQRQGRPVFIAIEDWEEPRFRRRFADQRFGGLDWAPAIEISAPVRVRFYDVRAHQRLR